MCFISAIALISIFCASVNAFPDSRIINGDVAIESQFPWHASIHALHSNGQTRYIGGSIISQNFILTTASFLIGAKNVKIQMGSTSFTKPLISMESQKYFIHPNYNPDTKAFDMALIQLPWNLQYSNNIRPIRLPSRWQANEKFVGANAIISGFGITAEGSVYLSEKLKFARTSVISNGVCEQSVPFGNEQTLMCAVSINYVPQSGTPCRGDTGGALVINEGNTWTQIGLANSAPKGCDVGTPTLYTRVTYALDWIANISGVPVRV